MNVGILTFHASHNYGSMLQAYALQRILDKIGVDNEIINFRTDIQKSLTPPPISLSHPRSSALTCLKNPTRTWMLLKKYHRFEQFLNTFLNTSKELHSAKEIEDYVRLRQFDAIITGSDQIWNPACWDFDMSYLIDFDYGGKRIAYAPSLGSHPEDITNNDMNMLIKALERYDSLSTRESRGQNFLSQFINREIKAVLDPTMLLDKTDYMEIANVRIPVKEPYIFYYTPREESGFFRKAREFAQKQGIKILVTQSYEEYCGDNVVKMLDCGPREFLSIIKNATLCIGNSFHLLAFSLIFLREFILLSNETDSRMMNILSLVGLTDRLIVGDASISYNDQIDFGAVLKKLSSLKDESMRYLENALV